MKKKRGLARESLPFAATGAVTPVLIWQG